MENGADPRIKDNNGQTAYDYAESVSGSFLDEKKCEKVMLYLLEMTPLFSFITKCIVKQNNWIVHLIHTW